MLCQAAGSAGEVGPVMIFLLAESVAAPPASFCSSIVALIYLFSGRWYKGKLRLHYFHRSRPEEER